MRLKRNITPDGMCKYSLIEHEKSDHIEDGLPNTESDFFVIKLKDAHAQAALLGYLHSLTSQDEYDAEYAMDIRDLAKMAGPDSKWCKQPD